MLCDMSMKMVVSSSNALGLQMCFESVVLPFECFFFFIVGFPIATNSPAATGTSGDRIDEKDQPFGELLREETTSGFRPKIYRNMDPKNYLKKGLRSKNGKKLKFRYVDLKLLIYLNKKQITDEHNCNKIAREITSLPTCLEKL